MKLLRLDSLHEISGRRRGVHSLIKFVVKEIRRYCLLWKNTENVLEPTKFLEQCPLYSCRMHKRVLEVTLPFSVWRRQWSKKWPFTIRS